jgi:hypothetical protein
MTSEILIISFIAISIMGGILMYINPFYNKDNRPNYFNMIIAFMYYTMMLGFVLIGILTVFYESN